MICARQTFMLYFAAALLTGSAVASPKITCPNTALIKKEGATTTLADYLPTADGLFFPLKISHFNTKNQWFFGVIDLESISKIEALRRMKSTFVTMQSSGVPHYFGKNSNDFFCVYKTNQADRIAFAISDISVIDNTRNLLSMLSLLQLQSLNQ